VPGCSKYLTFVIQKPPKTMSLEPYHPVDLETIVIVAKRLGWTNTILLVKMRKAGFEFDLLEVVEVKPKPKRERERLRMMAEDRHPGLEFVPDDDE